MHGFSCGFDRAGGSPAGALGVDAFRSAQGTLILSVLWTLSVLAFFFSGTASAQPVAASHLAPSAPSSRPLDSLSAAPSVSTPAQRHIPNSDSLAGRRSKLRAARAQNARTLQSPELAPLERLLLWAENSRVLKYVGALSKQKVRVLPGGIGARTGPGLRLAYVPTNRHPHLNAQLSAGASTLGYWRSGARVGYRRDGWFGHLRSELRRHPETIQAAPNEAARPERIDLDMRSWTSGAVLGLRPLPALTLAASSAYLRQRPRPDASSAAPGSRVLFASATTRYLTVGGHLVLDLRDVPRGRRVGSRFLPSSDPLTARPFNPDHGTFVALDVVRFRETGALDASFRRTTAEVQQYVSFLNGYHTFALRHRTVLTNPDARHAVPSYLQPSLGGNFTLRGYNDFRFQGGLNALLYNVEYRYQIWHHMDMVFFADAGKLFDRLGQWGVTGLHYSYGVGLRYITPQSALMRFGVAFNENQAARLVLEFDNVF
jgi:hypothetical protein